MHDQFYFDTACYNFIIRLFFFTSGVKSIGPDIQNAAVTLKIKSSTGLAAKLANLLRSLFNWKYNAIPGYCSYRVHGENSDPVIFRRLNCVINSALAFKQKDYLVAIQIISFPRSDVGLFLLPIALSYPSPFWRLGS